MPITEYNHDTGISICGGYMYRGDSYPSFHGNYFFGDWSGKLFCIRKMSDNSWKRIPLDVNGTGKNETDAKINAMGEDAHGDVYIITQKLFGPRSPTGALYKITP
jgi:hypothetical protein